jgi:hypothetical protein
MKMRFLFGGLMIFLLKNEMYSTNDTTVIVFEKYSFNKFKNSDPSEYIYMNDTLYWVGKKRALKLDNVRFQENSKAVEGALFKCCKILDKTNVIARTGKWTVESIYNDYVEYYKNGALKVKGMYSADNAWLKINTWEYHNVKGIIIRKEVYSMEGKLLRQE